MLLQLGSYLLLKLLDVSRVKQHLMAESHADRDSLMSSAFFGEKYKETYGSL